MLGKGEDSNRDGWLDSGEVFDYASRRLADLGRSQDPLFIPRGAVKLVHLRD